MAADTTLAGEVDSLRFGPFELDISEGVLRREGETLPLQDLPFRLLVELARRAPDVVSREDLAACLWPPGTHLEVDGSLNTAVARVREALGDSASEPRFVATVPRRGYKLLVPVVVFGRGERRSRRTIVAAALLLMAAALAVGLYRVDSSKRSPPERGGARTLSGGAGDEVREHLLIGRHHADKRSREGLERAIASFQSAAALDPGNAEALSGLAAAYALLGIYDYWRPREAFAPAETFARRALEMDDGSAEAHLAMGLVAAVAHWDWAAAGEELERSKSLAPESAMLWYWQGAYLAATGRHGEAIANTERALRLDPTSPVINAALAWRLFQARRGEEAVAQAHRAISLEGTSFDAWDNLKWIHLTYGNEAEAVEAWRRAVELAGGDGKSLAETYQQGGLEGLHRSSLKYQLGRWERGSYHSPYDIVLEYCALGEVESALLWLERSLAEREPDLIDLAVDPRVDRLRQKPRFQEILTRVGLPGTDPAAEAAE